MSITDFAKPRSDRSLSFNDRMARGLGWFSLGLGLAEIVAPGTLSRTLGLEGKEKLLQGFGAREIAAGAGALTLSDPTPAMWSRFAGDLLDLGVLAIGARNGDEEQRRNAGIAIAAVGAITLVDLFVAAGLTKERHMDGGYQARDMSEDAKETPALEAA